MKVNKEVFYHANSGEELSIGDILIFNKDTHNKMYEEVYNSGFKLNNMDTTELLIYKKSNKDTSFTIEEFETILNTVNNDAFVMRELALEEIRKEKHPNYPSRLNCLYVTKEKETAIDWSNI